MVLDACFIVKLLVCFKNTTTELDCGNMVMCVEKCNKLVVEPTVPGTHRAWLWVGAFLAGF